MRHGLSLLIVLAAILGVDCAPQRPASPVHDRTSPASPGRGPYLEPASVPSTRLMTLDGASTDLRSVLRGRVAVVSFWATWCDACLAEIEALKRLQAQTRTRGDMLVVGVAVGEARETVAAFARKRGIGYEQLVDEDFRLADALGQERVPATLVVDRAGRIVFRGGALDPAGLAAFRSALGGFSE
jgi:thiol-disulfide isomerase/thioredoxin